MISSDTAAFTTTSEDAIISLDSEWRTDFALPLGRARKTPLRVFRGLVPAALLSMFASTASVRADSQNIFSADSSIMLTRYLLARRRISQAEARQRALRALWLSEERRSSFAELEAREFEALYGWMLR